MIAPSTGAGVYEQWVDALKAWAVDPAIDLSHLPSLAADTFTPATYQRLIAHLNSSISMMMNTWSARLSAAIAGATTEHDRAREMVQLRALLGRRLQLARHSGFPKEVSGPLWDGACRDIRSIQDSLERSAMTSSSRATVNHADMDRALALVRSNSFAAIIQPGFDLGSLFAPVATSMPEPFPADLTMPNNAVPSLTRRRVILD